MNVSDIEAEIRTHLPKLAQLNATVKLDMGADGSLFLDAAGEAATLSPGDGDADCAIRISADNMRKLMAGKLNAVTALAFGKIKVSGDKSVAAKLADLLRG